MTAFFNSVTALFQTLLFVESVSWLVELTSGCQLVYPSEYAYRSGLVYRHERSSANCNGYKRMAFVTEDDYIHCNGTQLRLTDSDYGSEQYSSNDYYVWEGGSSSQLLFIFSTRVNFTTITLHYYNDNARGLPRLRLFVVPDNFEIWDAPSGSYSRVEVSAITPGGNLGGHRNVSIKYSFMTKKVLLYKYRSDFAFVVSEFEFLTCNGSRQDNTTEQNHSTTTETMAKETSIMSNINTSERDSINKLPTEVTISNSVAEDLITTTTTLTGKQEASGYSASAEIIVTAIVIVIVFVTLLTILSAITLVFFLRKSAKRKVDYNSTYSTLSRDDQSQSLHTSNDLYDQIQLSPSTGQAEFISRNETAKTNNPLPHQTEYGIHPSVDKDKPKSAKLKITASTISTQDEDKSTSEQPTYAVVNKKKKQKTENESVHCQSKDIAEVSQNEGVTEQNAVEHGRHDQESQDKYSPDSTMQFSSQTIDSLQELYTVVKKKPKDRPAEDDIAPPIPPYTTEELYTAVKKKPKAYAAGEEQAPQIPPHTIEELYTAVQKKPKDNATDDEEEAPPIPAHTVEELYTAVVKKPKVSTAENEEEAPPVPPYTVDEL